MTQRGLYNYQHFDPINRKLARTFPLEQPVMLQIKSWPNRVNNYDQLQLVASPWASIEKIPFSLRYTERGKDTTRKFI